MFDRLASYTCTIHIYILLQNNVKKYPSSVRCRDLNPGRTVHVSPPSTTRPGLPPMVLFH